MWFLYLIVMSMGGKTKTKQRKKLIFYIKKGGMVVYFHSIRDSVYMTEKAKTLYTQCVKARPIYNVYFVFGICFG